ncbi:MAG: DMT family transporter [Gammaproteobacteria bacterium]|nr:DMT family transporter [Gammaproteobacteria bacterium]
MEFNNLKAALYVVIAMSMITTNDAIVKHITQVFNVGQIMFLRGTIICIIFGLVMRFRKQPVFNRQTLHRWNLFRALFELGATLAFLTGLSMLPIAVASTLGFASPIFLALLAALLLKENVGLDRWLVILIGFGGVMLITNPFADATSWAVIFPIICAFFVALRDIAIRFVPHDIPSSQVAFTNAWIVMLGGGLYSLYQGWGEADLSWYLWFFGLGAVLYCGYLFLIIGSRLGELSFISPFKYVSIIIAIVYGYLIWGDQPTLTMLAGAAIIVVSGIILVSTEKRRNRVASLLPEATK